MSEQKNPMWLAILAGAVVLGTGPLALAFLVLLGAGGEDGAFSELAQMVNEGGGASYGVLFAGALASLVAAVLAGISVRRPGLPASSALVPFVLPMLAALGGVVFGMRGALAAIAFAAPADRAVILVASSGELTALCVQALAFAAAGALAVSVAALVSLSGPGRGGRLLTLLGALTLALSLAATAAQDFRVRSGLGAMIRVSPSDRLTILASVLEEWRVLNRASNALLLASVLVAVIGAVLLAARARRAEGIAAAAALLVAAMGIRGVNAMSERSLSAPAGVPPGAELMTIDGHAPTTFRFVSLDETKIDAAVLVRAQLEVEDPRVGVELSRDASPKSLLRALQVAHFVRVNVELVGDAPKRKLDAPRVFAAALAAASDLQLVAPVRVLFTGEPCDGCDGNVKDWTPGEVSREGEFKALPGTEFAWTGDIDALVRASLVALSHQHVLVVRVPPPEPPPVLPDY